jgi:CCR4-NOT transcription complex subunit 10
MSAKWSENTDDGSLEKSDKAGADSGSQASSPVTPASNVPAVTDAERELAHQATEEFEKGNYDLCMKHLHKLNDSRSQDARVGHNLAIVEYYKTKFTKTNDFKRALKEISTKNHVNLDNIVGLDDVDQCVMYYNHAVMLYHTRQYNSALAIMDKVFQYIEPMGKENLSRRVVFFLVELLLSTHQPERAMGMLAFFEKNLLGNGKSSSPSGDKEKDSKEKDDKSTKDKDKDRDTSADGNGSDAWRARISQYKARCHIMVKSMKSCKREVKGLMNTLGLTTPVIYMKSQFEYLRGNYRKSIKVLNSASGGASAELQMLGLPTMYYNNLGVIHFYMRKHNLGALYFRKAIQENERLCKDLKAAEQTKTGRPVHTLGVSQHYELIYNMGLQLLHSSRPEAAFDCLLETIHMYRVNPRLWLRLAECCIMAYRPNNDDDRKLENRLKVVDGSVGSGVHRKLMLGSGIQEARPGCESSAIPVCTLEFASLCLKNALLLLPEDPLDNLPSTSEDGQETSKPTNENIMVSAPPSSPMKGPEVASVRCSVLAAGSYVALCLNDHITALKWAEKLLKQPRLSPALKYVGHMYTAEAKVALDHIADAVSHLNPDSVTDISLLPPETKQEQEKGEKNGERDPQETTERGMYYVLYIWAIFV